MAYLCSMEKKKTKTRRSRLRPIWWTLGIVAVIIAVAAAWGYHFLSGGYNGAPVRVYIPGDSSPEAVGDSLRSALGDERGEDVFMLWKARGGRVSVSEGSYLIKDGMTVYDISRKIINGQQDPVKVVFNNVRTIPQLAEKIAAKMEFDAGDFVAACDSLLGARGMTGEQYPAAFFPDTYEFYWDATPAVVVERLAGYRDAFWTADRRSKADALGLTPEQVATVASIVEEETAKIDERPKVARLYLNRIDKGMKLQADPTVKFACGDFTLRRILDRHLSVESPYNTYLHEGLPPGPIRVVEKSTVDAVLDAPTHQYLYMCAREDFSGYHNFAVSYADHKANADRYRRELNRRGIR